MRAPPDAADAYSQYSVHRPAMRLRLNPVECVAHGLSVELVPEWAQLDDWGYPMAGDGERPPELVDDARRAAQVCPTLALLLESDRE